MVFLGVRNYESLGDARFKEVLRDKGNGYLSKILTGLYLKYIRTRAVFSVSTNIGKVMEIEKLQFYRIK